jgi:hypothetical protein
MDRLSEVRRGGSTGGRGNAAASLGPVATAEHARPLAKPVPGTLFRWVKVVSWFESLLFAALLFFWIAPGYHSETSLFGLLHGLGYLGLLALIFWAVMRREAPWPLLAATLTPIGPFGTVIGIELIERKGWGIEPRVLTPPDQTGNNPRRREDVIPS